MNTQVETDVSVLDIVKQVASVVCLVASIGGFYYFSDVQLLYRVMGLLVVFSGVVAMMLTTVLGRSIWAFSVESKLEVKKVVWPTRDETMKTTLMVFAMVTVVGLVLWLLDTVLFWGVRLLTGQGG
ncbi:preprotein translocase subunit SecE [Methylovulum psychrotolerans]|jgi:preprotein translocase subunit SecE|uniref:Protein translocase subunit SecE n=1 Tax=Methylovulum psychrotolerans TaxID=1704499 RepID=A0A1Z4BWB1_9GAMM|nr:preprotein translocase subunit SecE [Methylovulum psychrotolerans]ASF45530.1 preprotein translocase subunit SecE [Methylovulum psychrotolerans]MBT9098479.1 preprotein translocase subunit SecE [Methylovulum psychrotolerans]POZ52933.1 preprotein translocase subunit SecE [Methylovulum psychrotolerans]